MTRGKVLLGAALIAGGLGWVAFRSLSGNVVYYQTPTEVLTRVGAGERVRMGGLVVMGSVRRSGEAVRFMVTDGATRMSVIGTGGVPSLFRDGQGVVVEGFYGRDGAFHADTILVKHGSEYRPPRPGETPSFAEIEAGG